MTYLLGEFPMAARRAPRLVPAAVKVMPAATVPAGKASPAPSSSHLFGTDRDRIRRIGSCRGATHFRRSIAWPDAAPRCTETMLPCLRLPAASPPVHPRLCFARPLREGN
jgi:hypothetical protein